MEFVAIDFETANASRSSACSIGLVTVRHGKITDEYYKLIRPKNLYFNADNIAVHGITEEMVADEPTFEELWPEIFPRLHNKQVVAHFAKFDINVLAQTLNVHYLPYPNFTYICSWILAKKALPNLSGYSLDNVAQQVGFSFAHHHALEDAKACAAIVSHVLSKHPHIQDFEQLADFYGFSCGKMLRGRIIPCTAEKPEGTTIMDSLF